MSQLPWWNSMLAYVELAFPTGLQLFESTAGDLLSSHEKYTIGFQIVLSFLPTKWAYWNKVLFVEDEKDANMKLVTLISIHVWPLSSKLKATGIMHTTSKHDPDFIVVVCRLVSEKEICLLLTLKNSVWNVIFNFIGYNPSVDLWDAEWKQEEKTSCFMTTIYLMWPKIWTSTAPLLPTFFPSFLPSLVWGFNIPAVNNNLIFPEADGLVWMGYKQPFLQRVLVFWTQITDGEKEANEFHIN